MRPPSYIVRDACFFRKLLTRAKCTLAEESDVEMHSWIPGYVLTKYRDYTMSLRANNDGNGCVLSAKYAAGAQYDRRPTMLIILGTLSLRYIFPALVFSRRRYVSRASKISQKVKRVSNIFREFAHILNAHIPPSRVYTTLNLLRKCCAFHVKYISHLRAARV